MELQRDAIRAMLRVAFDAGMVTADQTALAGARCAFRDDWLDGFIGKLGGNPHPTPADFIAVGRPEFDKLRALVVQLTDIYIAEHERDIGSDWKVLRRTRYEVVNGD